MTPTIFFLSYLIITLLLFFVKPLYGYVLYFPLLFFPYVNTIPILGLSLQFYCSSIFVIILLIRNRLSVPYFKTTILVYLLFLFPSFLFANTSNTIITQIIRFFVFALSTFAPAVIFVSVFRSHKDVKIFMRYFIVYLFILFTYGLVELLRNFDNPFWNWYNSYFDFTDYGNRQIEERLGFLGRLRSLHTHSIVYGGRLVLFFVLIIGVLRTKSLRILYLKRYIVFMYVLIFLLFLNLIFTLSRSCWLFQISFIFILLYIYSNKGQTYSLLFILKWFVLFPLFAYGFFYLYTYVNDFDSFQGSSIATRQVQLDVIWDYVTSNSGFFGFGFGSMYEAAYNSKSLKEALGFESIFFEVLYEYGFLGVFSYLLFFIMIIFSLYRRYRFIINFYFTVSLTLSYLIFVLLTGERQTLFLFFFTLVFLVHINKLNSIRAHA